MANSITITGALGRAPGLNFTQSGKAAWGFSLAYTPSRKNDQTGQWEDTGPTLWFDVTAWGEDAEDLANRYSGVEKGRATVTGRLGSRTWTNKDGVEQLQMTITADAVTIHPPKVQQGNQWGNQQRQAPPQQQAQPQRPTPAPQAQQQTMPASGGWGGGAPDYSEPPF